MRLRPLNDRVLVRRLSQETLSSRIVVPDCAQQPSLIGEVVAVGPGKRRENGTRQPLDVKPGQLVAFGKFTDYDDDEFVLIQEGDIRGIVNTPCALVETTQWI